MSSLARGKRLDYHLPAILTAHVVVSACAAVRCGDKKKELFEELMASAKAPKQESQVNIYKKKKSIDEERRKTGKGKEDNSINCH